MENSIQQEKKTVKVFLIDFENVHEQGLAGIGQLTPEDAVHLFYTKNASKISLDILSEVRAKLAFHKVNVGKQSLDMQLVSYLGYLIGTSGADPEYVIVSNDAGFANTLAFWGEKAKKISQSPYINYAPAPAPAPEEPPAEPETQNRPAAEAQSHPAPEAQNHPARGATEKTQVNNRITVALRDRKVEADKIGKATATVMKLYGVRNFRQAAYREIIRQFGQKEGLEIYNIIKPIITNG